jgi:hypothetical protein
LAFLPCTLVTIPVMGLLILRLYPPEDTAPEGAMAFIEDELRKMGSLSLQGKKALLIMLLAVALWMTDLLHHISLAIIGLGAGLLAAMPFLGILDQEDLKRVNYLPVFFVASAISMSDVLVETKALRHLTAVMFGPGSWGPGIGIHVGNRIVRQRKVIVLARHHRHFPFTSTVACPGGQSRKACQRRNVLPRQLHVLCRVIFRPGHRAPSIP